MSRLAAGLPAALAAATVLHYAVRGRSLPAELPSAWDRSGAPTRWTSKRRAATTDLATTIVPAALAACAARSERPPAARLATIGALTAVAVVGAALTVWRSLDRGRSVDDDLLLGVAMQAASRFGDRTRQ